MRGQQPRAVDAGRCPAASGPGRERRPWTNWRLDGYSYAMSTHSVAQARNHLSELIDRALDGEGIVITRHGQPVVELRPVEQAAAPVSAGDLDWLAERRVGRVAARSDAGALVSSLRDEAER